MNERKKIFWFAIISRIIVLNLQFIFNFLFPDHNADAFKSPIDNSEQISSYDNIIIFLFNGLTRWDGQYFLHIAKYGYTYENTLAFYPLYPMLIRIISVSIRKIFFKLNIHSSILIAAVLINIICFVKSAVIFYDLSKIILKKTNIAYIAAILYCINPATIFFSAVYSESLFAYLTFSSMLKSIKLDPYVSIPIGLSILTRSNGIVNIGFPIYYQLKKLFYNYTIKDINFSFKKFYQFILKIIILKNFCLIFSTIIISIIPFILLQIYNYVMFCIPNQTFIPEHIVNFSIINNLVLPGNNNEWCYSKVPLAYSYVQKKYWNIGFLNYYEIKQVPNFILAFPILYIMIKCIKEYFFEHKKYFYTLGFIKNIENNVKTEKKQYPIKMLVFIIHGLFLTIFCILFVHIQVSTRLISSASPLIYWYCALSIYNTFDDNDDNNLMICNNKENTVSKWNIFLLLKKKYTLREKLIFSYFLGYTILGCFMFSNFLPWT